ncbi:RAQPRD family integrative conjugative element protein [Pseudomonas sp. VE 196-7]|uniref:integrative conjugative element protein, RAQPRD family n=1 Tax=Pseudomonas sp. VE 196-7 TaxID=2956726 RepID=UPI0021D4F3E3|nr:RAQPRD family integrative conjugative element protein [Pseudomonas sp. VE 196-7]MCU7213650.1 RAQPRD family integrative conjugative element protein [Pseudomonas sp. VE 196-7]
MSVFPLRFLTLAVIAFHSNSFAASGQEQLFLLIRQLDTLDTLVRSAPRFEAPESNARYRFDYPRLTHDIQRIRQGVKGYLSPSRAQPRDPTELVGDYRLDAPSAEPSP